MRRKSKTPEAKLKEKLMNMVKAQVRARDEFTCQKCGKYVEGSNCHVSHVIPVSAGNALKYDGMNMKVLCFHCHINWWHKEPTASGDWFKAKFPDRWAYLEEHREDEVHWKLHDYKRMIEELK